METQTLIALSPFITLGALIFLYQNHILRKAQERLREKREREVDEKFKLLFEEIKKAGLTDREKEILVMMADKTNNEIADLICRSRETVKKIKSNLHKKLNVSHDKDLIKFALALIEAMGHK